jgi:hypothetical protein
MPIKSIIRAVCDTCNIEEPSKYITIEFGDGQSDMVICKDCLNMFGKVSGEKLYEFARYITESAKHTSLCTNCNILYETGSRTSWKAVRPQLEAFTRLNTPRNILRDE